MFLRMSLILVLYISLYAVQAGKVQNPIRFRVDTRMLIDMFHKGDQSILDAYSDIVTSMRGRRDYVNEPKANLLDSDDRCPDINYYQYSLVPTKGKTE